MHARFSHLISALILATFILPFAWVRGTGFELTVPPQAESDTLNAATTTRVSVASDGSQGNGYSHNPSISADRRYVAFESSASNLVGGDTNNADDVFVRDLLTGFTQRVSLASNGGQGNSNSGLSSISDNGRYVAFASLATNLVDGDTVVTPMSSFNRQTGSTSAPRYSVDQGMVIPCHPHLANGRYVASSASNLVGGDTNNADDVLCAISD
jgi:Tol biopolymer transport system component